jgi:hypothetical protein
MRELAEVGGVHSTAKIRDNKTLKQGRGSTLEKLIWKTERPILMQIY